jgi:hypothetical protein
MPKRRNYEDDEDGDNEGDFEEAGDENDMDIDDEGKFTTSITMNTYSPFILKQNSQFFSCCYRG